MRCWHFTPTWQPNQCYWRQPVGIRDNLRINTLSQFQDGCSVSAGKVCWFTKHFFWNSIYAICSVQLNWFKGLNWPQVTYFTKNFTDDRLICYIGDNMEVLTTVGPTQDGVKFNSRGLHHKHMSRTTEYANEGTFAEIVLTKHLCVFYAFTLSLVVLPLVELCS